jgi:acetyl esterase/lipase
MTEINRRDLGLGLLGTISASSLLTSSSIAAPAGVTDPFALVDPELLATAKALPPTTISKATLPMMRARLGMPPKPAPAPQPVMKTIPGPKGAPDISVMVIDGTGGQKGCPAYLHMHGGGFVGGRVDGNPASLQDIAATCGALVVSVDYRLAPETPFPGALEDNYAALKWMNLNRASLGIDPKRIAIGGESAGGGHAAMLAIAARDRGEYAITFQLLIYPMLDDRTGSTKPAPEHIGHFLWNSGSNRFGWESLLGMAPGSANPPAGSVPARVKDLSGLPPTFISVGALDLFVDEDVDYARRLIAAGVSTELLAVPGAYHGFNGLVPKASVSVRFNAQALSALKRGWGLS